MNNWDNRILFKDIIKILDEIIDNKLVSNDKRRKLPFFLTPEQISGIELSDVPISISAFVRSINLSCVLENMKKLKVLKFPVTVMANTNRKLLKNTDQLSIFSNN